MSEHVELVRNLLLDGGYQIELVGAELRVSLQNRAISKTEIEMVLDSLVEDDLVEVCSSFNGRSVVVKING